MEKSAFFFSSFMGTFNLIFSTMNYHILFLWLAFFFLNFIYQDCGILFSLCPFASLNF